MGYTLLMNWINLMVLKEHKIKNMVKELGIKGLSIVALISGFAALMAFTDEPGAVQWLTFEQAVEKSKIEKRPIFIDVYTDWCGWCKVMDKNTFNDPDVAKLLNEKFYPVKFDAEQREDVVFKGNTFKFVPSGNNGYHELAAALLNNKLSYPTVVFLNEEFGMLQPIAGFRKREEFHPIAQFIGEGHYKSMKWEDWQKRYQSPYK